MTVFDDPDAGRGVSGYHGLAISELEADNRLEGRAEADPHLLDDAGRLRSGMLLGMVDTVGGICGGLASLPRWVVSTNIAAQVVPTPVTGPIRLDAHILRVGNRGTVTAIAGFDEGTGRRLCEAVLTSAALEPSGGPPDHARPLRLPVAPRDDDPPTPEDFYGIRPRRDGSGDGVELDLDAHVRNPWGILHGGVTTSLIGAAVDIAMGRPTPITSEVLRFLAPGRVGPVSAHAVAIGDRPNATVLRVEVRDHGADDRLIAFAVVTTRDDPDH